MIGPASARVFVSSSNRSVAKKCKPERERETKKISFDLLHRSVERLKMMSDLPRDVAEDVLLRLPVKSMRAVRLACKNWNTLSKSRRFRKRHLAEIKAASESMVVMMMGEGLYLSGINMHGIHKGLEPSINYQGKLFNLTGDKNFELFEVCHCDGLLFGVLRDFTGVVVWNPYLGQTRWIKPLSYAPRTCYRYAIGYDQDTKSSSSSCHHKYKILRYFQSSPKHVRYEVYYLNKSRDDTSIPVTILSDWDMMFYARGASVKGNTYWFAQEQIPDGDYPERIYVADFLICFDFKRERFGPRLKLPFHSVNEDCVSLSSVRDEQLAVLYQSEYTLFLEIWITNKIEPDEVSWNSKVFLAVDLDSRGIFFPCDEGCFFVDEEKKVAVVFSEKAYVIGEDGYVREMDIPSFQMNRSQFPPVLLCSKFSANQATSRQKEETRLLNTRVALVYFLFSVVICCPFEELSVGL